MHRLELRDVLLATAPRLSAAVLLPLVMMIVTKQVGLESMLAFCYGLVVTGYWVAIHLGITAFRREIDDGAFDYILAAPLSSLKLWFMKLAPRLIVLSSLSLVTWAMMHGVAIDDPSLGTGLDMPSFLEPHLFLPWMCLLFATGFSLSLVDWGTARLAVMAGIPVAWWLFGWLGKALLSPFGLDWLSPCICMAVLGCYFYFSWQALVGRPPLAFLRMGKQIDASVSTPSSWKVGRWSRMAGLVPHEFDQLCRTEWISWLWLLLIPLLCWMRIEVDGRVLVFDQLALAIVAMGLMVLGKAFLHGFHMFRQEFRDRAWEYLLAAPLSFDGVIAQKIAARLLILLPGVAIFLALQVGYEDRVMAQSGALFPVLQPPYYLAGLVLTLISGVFLSPFAQEGVQAWVSLAFLYAVTLPPIALGKLLHDSGPGTPGHLHPFLLTCSGLIPSLLVLGWAFFIARHRFDLLAPTRHDPRRGLSTLIPLALIAAASGAVLIFA